MKLNNNVIVITGGASGIGKAMAEEFHRRGGKVAIADINDQQGQAVADSINGIYVHCDATCEQDIVNLIEQVENQLGAIDCFCSNAGLGRGEGSTAASASNEIWKLQLDIHLMSHVYAARALLPRMLERGSGHLVQVSSAAGLLCQIGDAAYTASKHAACGFAKSLMLTHGDSGINVSLVCPMYVDTPLVGIPEGDNLEDYQGVISVEQAVNTIADGIEANQFLIYTHPETAHHMQFQYADNDAWISSMLAYKQQLYSSTNQSDVANFNVAEALRKR